MTRRGVDSLMGVHPHGLLDIGQLFGSGVARFSRQKQWCSMFHLFIWPMSSPNSWGEVLRLLSTQNSVQFVLLKWIFPIIFAVTLPPIIIHDHGSVENRCLSPNGLFLSIFHIFHFHDGRKGTKWCFPTQRWQLRAGFRTWYIEVTGMEIWETQCFFSKKTDAKDYSIVSVLQIGTTHFD